MLKKVLRICVAGWRLALSEGSGPAQLVLRDSEQLGRQRIPRPTALFSMLLIITLIITVMVVSCRTCTEERVHDDVHHVIDHSG